MLRKGFFEIAGISRAIPRTEPRTVCKCIALQCAGKPHPRTSGPGPFFWPENAGKFGKYFGILCRYAILDTGVDMGHEIFRTAPKSPSLTREKLQSMLEQYDFQAEQIISGISVSDLYYSVKIPFQFDYGDRDKDGMPGDKGSHGTHVASTAAGNTGVNEAAMGVAPQAQIINMNVFKSTGGASYSDILAALEDCILLSVDVANLSLGSDCGYIDYDSEDAFTKWTAFSSPPIM